MGKWIDFAAVRAAADFRAVLAHYGIEAPRGRQVKVRCPFHEDTKPSCSINLERGVFHCFGGGCEAQGNVLDFVARMDGCSVRQAAAAVVRICDLTLPEAEAAPPPGPSRSQRPPRGHRSRENGREGSETMNEPSPPGDGADGPPGGADEQASVNPPLTFQLKLDPEHPYLAERGLSRDVIEAFGLGHCTRGLMTGRVCIPIHDDAGQLVAYAGRWAGPDDTLPEGKDRYELPPRFRKTHVLFNLHRATERWRPDVPLVLVEGFFGAIRLHTLGVPVVAAMGTSLSPEQTLLLKRCGSLLTLLLDGDQAGREAAERLLPTLAEAFHVHLARLPEGTQPDTIAEDELRRLIEVPG